MKRSIPRVRAVQLDLFSPVDGVGNLVAGPDGAPRFHEWLAMERCAESSPAAANMGIRDDRFQDGLHRVKREGLHFTEL